MTDGITVEVKVIMDNQERIYLATKESLNEARFHAEKKARAFLRRKGLSVRMDNVAKERCPDCETKTTITVYDLKVTPKPKIQEVDNLDWVLEVSM